MNCDRFNKKTTHTLNEQVKKLQNKDLFPYHGAMEKEFLLCEQCSLQGGIFLLRR